MLKSKPDRYGPIAVSIHWLSALMILALLGSAPGFRVANAMDAAAKAGFLRFHIMVYLPPSSGRERSSKSNRIAHCIEDLDPQCAAF
jgi:hypothetical protein